MSELLIERLKKHFPDVEIFEEGRCCCCNIKTTILFLTEYGLCARCLQSLSNLVEPNEFTHSE